MRILSFFCFCAFFRGFLILTFVRGISESRHQWIWNQHKILRVFDTHIDVFQEKIFLGHNSTFCNLKMQMRTKLCLFKHFAKRKKLFFSKYLSFSVWFPLSLKDWSPLACTPHPYQPGLILPSWSNVRQKAGVATLCTLWARVMPWLASCPD